jgi:transcriptional regulator with XRE-family HTH domain
MRQDLKTKNRIAELRGNMKVQDVADMIGCSKSAFQSWQSGRRTPGLEYVKYLEKALGTTIDKIYPDLFKE